MRSVYRLRLAKRPAEFSSPFGRGQRSAVWEHFKRTEKEAVCKYCEKTLAYAGGTSNLWAQHIKRVHSTRLEESGLRTPTLGASAKRPASTQSSFLKWSYQICPHSLYLLQLFLVFFSLIRLFSPLSFFFSFSPLSSLSLSPLSPSVSHSWLHSSFMYYFVLPCWMTIVFDVSAKVCWLWRHNSVMFGKWRHELQTTNIRIFVR